MPSTSTISFSNRLPQEWTNFTFFSATSFVVTAVSRSNSVDKGENMMYTISFSSCLIFLNEKLLGFLWLFPFHCSTPLRWITYTPQLNPSSTLFFNFFLITLRFELERSFFRLGRGLFVASDPCKVHLWFLSLSNKRVHIRGGD